LPTVSDSAVKITSVSDVSAIGRGANSAGDGAKSGGKLFSQLLEVNSPELKCSLPFTLYYGSIANWAYVVMVRCFYHPQLIFKFSNF
jgi:hypothetical protein